MKVNPKGPSEGEYRAARGGSWSLGATACRVAYRFGNGATCAGNYLGFRVVAAPAVGENHREAKSRG